MINKIKYFKDKPGLADFLDLAVICVATIIIAKLLTTFIVLTGFVPSQSMENLIMTNDRIFADRMAYWNAEPQRGDIAVFYAPDEKANGEIKHFVKRIIGLPGETVAFKDGYVYVDNVRLDEPYLEPDTSTRSGKHDSFQVPEGYYFMLGDNRNNSSDSREWDNSFVPFEDIQGKVFIKFSLRWDNLHIKTVQSYNDYNTEE